MSRRVVAVTISLLAFPVLAADDEFVGKWDLTLLEGRMVKEGFWHR
jgi:hypothetical protein